MGLVNLSYENPHIAVICLNNPAEKNTFTMNFIKEMAEIIDKINDRKETKVVLMYGNGLYFSAGGSKEMLLDIAEGKYTFADSRYYSCISCLLNFDIPTIAAMQGHAVGGGLAFGLYADIILLAEECFYSSNFMKYGFTPGAGSTFLVPEKCGKTLGTEMLFTGNNYQGYQLKERGVSALVVKKQEVLQQALSMANDLAEMPLLSLKELKLNLSRHIKENVKNAVKLELEMHQKTFVRDDTKEMIKRLYK